MMISLILKMKLVQSVTQWPPLASDLSIDAVWNIVPYQLYNLLAWTGLCDEFLPDLNYVSVERHRLKLLSVCQDIIYLASGGRICLGLTLRHPTGSQTVVVWSGPLCIDYDSALAEYRRKADGIVPFGFEYIFTSLVVDNNDFKEQTLSGKGTTHCTTGLAVQCKLNCPSVEPTCQSLPKVQNTKITAPGDDFRKVSNTSKCIGPTQLIGLHAFMGCDSTSSFKGKGKKQPLQVLSKNVDYIPALSVVTFVVHLQESMGGSWMMTVFQCHG